MVKNVGTGSGTIIFKSEDGGTDLATLTLEGGVIAVNDAAKKAIGELDDEIEVFIVYNQEGTSHIPSMQFDIEHMDVSTTERKMKMSWTKEAEHYKQYILSDYIYLKF